jgi:4-aminobutyrate aminotransferase-like enzyme
VLLSCGLYSNVIRFLAPLTIPDALLKEGFNLLEQSLDEVTRAASAA